MLDAEGRARPHLQLSGPAPPRLHPDFTGPRKPATPMQFDGTRRYVATDDLKVAVNAAITLQPPPPRQRRARHRQDGAGARGRRRHRGAAHRVAHQVDDQGPAGPLRVRRRLRACATASSATSASTTSATTSAGQAVGGVPARRAPGAADRRDRQGRHRVPQRPAAGARPHGVLRLRDAARPSRRCTAPS